ncbi:small proline-rich protein 2H-like [Phlebotomus papatasi]|uniref:small proline-rich protein 2H-like n=1 Tax=Phlebotomus papatasi TaxID=29031 RepID=UPI0024840FDE|nr:small proline-rich protein 2H-like [Phlebotomus papatasi]
MSGIVLILVVSAVIGVSMPVNSSPVVDRDICTPCETTTPCPPCETTTTCPPCETTTTPCPPCPETEGPGGGGPGGPGGPEDGYGPPPDCTREQLPRLFPTYHPEFFWQCRSINDALIMPCGPGTVFSYELQYCTWP